MDTLKELNRKIELVFRSDEELTEIGIEYREHLIESIESLHDKVVKFRRKL